MGIRMKNIIASIVLLITISLVFLDCVEDEPKNEAPTDVTGDTTSVADTTKAEETTASSDDDVVTLPIEVKVYYDNGDFSFSEDLLAVTDGVVCFYLEAKPEMIVSMFGEIYSITGKERFTVTHIKCVDNAVIVTACFGEEREHINEICIDIGRRSGLLSSIIYFMLDDYESYNNIKRIVINDAIINIQGTEYGYHEVTSISAYGHEAKLKNPKALTGRNGVIHYVHQAEDIFAIDFDKEWGEIYIFTKDSCIEILPSTVDWEKDPYFYNVSFYNYEVDENGRLIYSRRPYKYTFQGGCFNGMVEYCCGYDELWMEKGVVSVENGEVVYTPERKYTVKEGIENFKDIYNYHTQVNYIPIEEFYEEYYREEFEKELGIKSIEELFEYNKAHYEVYN